VTKNRIKDLRLRKGLSQSELAKKVGISNQVISFYENNKREPKIENWQKLADFFGVSVPYLQGTSSKKDIIKLLSDGYNEGFTYQHSRENENNILASIAKSIGSETMQNMVEFQKEYGNLKKVIDLYAELMNLEVPKDEKERVKFFTDKMGFLFEMPEGQRLLHATHSYTDTEVKESLLDALLNFTNMLYHSSKFDKINDKHQ
jgi:transcriptional regulator with XRE-family HTH domain